MGRRFFLRLAVSILLSILSVSSESVAQGNWRPTVPRPTERVRPLAENRTELIQDATDVLFDRLAPWVFVEFRPVERYPMGRYLITATGRKTDWLIPGKTLEGAGIIKFMNTDRARLVYGEAHQDLLFVPVKAPQYDPTRKRTPEEIAAAQRRYSEFYMKQFIVSGKEYARQRGNPSAPRHQWYPQP